MEHLLTIASDGWGSRMRRIPRRPGRDLRRRTLQGLLASGRPSTSQDALVPDAIPLGGIGCLSQFTCTTCRNHALDGCEQMTWPVHKPARQLRQVRLQARNGLSLTVLGGRDWADGYHRPGR